MWPWSRVIPQKTLENGAMYRAPVSGLLVETATILGHFNDPSGIPHVRYALKVTTQTGASDAEELRALSIGAFVRRYTEFCGKKGETGATEMVGPVKPETV